MNQQLLRKHQKTRVGSTTWWDAVSREGKSIFRFENVNGKLQIWHIELDRASNWSDEEVKTNPKHLKVMTGPRRTKYDSHVKGSEIGRCKIGWHDFVKFEYERLVCFALVYKSESGDQLSFHETTTYFVDTARSVALDQTLLDCKEHKECI